MNPTLSWKETREKSWTENCVRYTGTARELTVLVAGFSGDCQSSL